MCHFAQRVKAWFGFASGVTIKKASVTLRFGRLSNYPANPMAALL